MPHSICHPHMLGAASAVSSPSTTPSSFRCGQWLACAQKPRGSFPDPRLPVVLLYGVPPSWILLSVFGSEMVAGTLAPWMESSSKSRASLSSCSSGNGLSKGQQWTWKKTTKATFSIRSKCLSQMAQPFWQYDINNTLLALRKLQARTTFACIMSNMWVCLKIQCHCGTQKMQVLDGENDD